MRVWLFWGVGGQGEGSKVKATKTSGGVGNASPSYNPPRDLNISSLCLC